MITVYAPDTLDWSNNGLGTLYPTSCPITEVAGGNYDLEINHPMTDDNRWTMLQKGYLIKTLVPKRDTPLIQQSAEARTERPEHIIWHVTAAAGGRLYTKASSGYATWSSSRTYNKGNKVNYQGKSYSWGSEIAGNATPPGGSWKKITTGSKLIKRLKAGEELLYLKSEDDAWSQVTVSDGTTGYMQTSTIAYLRTEPYIAAHPAYNTAVPPRQVRDQLFRIYNVIIDTEQHSVKALARHISYDQVRNFVKTYNPKGVPLQAALFSMSADMINEHDFAYYTNVTTEITAEWALKNGVLALLDPEQGAAAKTQAQVVRDNFDVFLLENIDVDRGVVIESGKNLLGVVSNVNDDNAVTRIMPYGTDKDGKMLLLPEVYIDSQFIDNYPNIRAVPLQVTEAVEKAPSGDDPGMTKEQCYEKMRAAVQAEYEKGVDLPDFDIKVTFVQLGDTEEYKAYRAMQQLYLYDLVTVKHGRLGLYYKTQVIGYTYDAALKRYTSMTLGNIKNGADLGAIAGFQLPNAGISGMKLMPGSVGSIQLRELSVLAAHIASLDATVILAETITADKIKAHDITAEQMKAGTITAESGILAELSVKNANIDTAGIDFAKIKDLIAGTAIIREGVGGKLYIDRLSVSEANVVNLTAGKLMVQATDGSFYRPTVNEDGEVVAILTQVSNDNIADLSLNAGEKLIKSSITAQCLDVDEIMGGSAFVGKVKSTHIASNQVEAKHIGPIAQEEVATSSTGQQLVVTFSNGTILDKNIITTEAEAKIYQNGVDITDSVPVAAFHWERISDDAEADETWNTAHAGVKSVTIESADVDFKCVFRCTVDEIAMRVSVSYNNGDLMITDGTTDISSDFSINENGELEYVGSGEYVYTDGFLLSKTSTSKLTIDITASNLKTAFINIFREGIEIYGSGYLRFLTDGEMTLEAGSKFNLRAGSGENAIGMSNNEENSYMLWAGNSDPAAAPYSVKRDGDIKATKLRLGNSQITNVTNTYAQHLYENADSSYPASFSIYIPDNTGSVASVKLAFKAQKYRAYSKAAAGQAIGTQQTNNTTSSDETPHNHTYPGHNHPISITFGIYEKPTLPTSCTLFVDGTEVATYTNTPPSVSELEISSYLSKTNGVINKGWHEINVAVNDDAMIVINYFVQTVVDSVTVNS